MKQPSYVTVCGTLIKMLFVLPVCFQKGGWETGWGYKLLDLSALFFYHHPGGVCPLFILPIVSEEKKSITAFCVSYSCHITRTDINMFSETNSVSLICEDSFQRAGFLYCFNEEY